MTSLSTDANRNRVSTLANFLRSQAQRISGWNAKKFLPGGEGDMVSLTYEELDRKARFIAAVL